jgi:hypothetical protein
MGLEHLLGSLGLKQLPGQYALVDLEQVVHSCEQTAPTEVRLNSFWPVGMLLLLYTLTHSFPVFSLSSSQFFSLFGVEGSVLGSYNVKNMPLHVLAKLHRSDSLYLYWFTIQIS